MNEKKERSIAQRKAEMKHDLKRRANSVRFGGRCSVSEKELLEQLRIITGAATEKEAVFIAAKKIINETKK